MNYPDHKKYLLVEKNDLDPDIYIIYHEDETKWGVIPLPMTSEEVIAPSEPITISKLEAPKATEFLSCDKLFYHMAKNEIGLEYDKFKQWTAYNWQNLTVKTNAHKIQINPHTIYRIGGIHIRQNILGENETVYHTGVVRITIPLGTCKNVEHMPLGMVVLASQWTQSHIFVVGETEEGMRLFMYNIIKDEWSIPIDKELEHDLDEVNMLQVTKYGATIGSNNNGSAWFYPFKEALDNH